MNLNEETCTFCFDNRYLRYQSSMGTLIRHAWSVVKYASTSSTTVLVLQSKKLTSHNPNHRAKGFRSVNKNITHYRICD